MRRNGRRGMAALALAAGLSAAPAGAQMQMLDPPQAAQPAPAAAPCGTEPLSIAQMPWPSASLLAQIHALLLEREFGCTVRLVGGDLAGTASSMATTRQPAIAPELWVSRTAEIWNAAVRAQSVRAIGPTFSGGGLEAWFVPDYVQEDHPGITSAAALAEHWTVFAGPEDAEAGDAAGARARLISCPEAWACAVINANLLRAHGLEDRFEIVVPADRFELDRLLAQAISRREPVLAYYWQPNPVIDQLGLAPLDMGAFNAEAMACLAQSNCAAPAPSAFAPDTIVVGAAEWVFADIPQIAAYFQRAVMPMAEMNRLLAFQTDSQASVMATAEHFLATAEPIWRGWVGD